MFQVNRKITRKTFTTNSPIKIDTVTKLQCNDCIFVN